MLGVKIWNFSKSQLKARKFKAQTQNKGHLPEQLPACSLKGNPGVTLTLALPYLTDSPWSIPAINWTTWPALASYLKWSNVTFMTQEGPFTGICVTLGKAYVEMVKISNKNNNCSDLFWHPIFMQVW